MKQTILIVDNNPDEAVQLRRILNHAGYMNTITLQDGKETINYLKSKSASLIISEIEIPYLNGYELCLSIKSSTILQPIPFIICSILTDPENIIRGLEYMADFYITKPYKKDILLAAVKECFTIPLQLNYSKGMQREEILSDNCKYSIGASRQRIINYLITTYQNILQQSKDQAFLQDELKKAYAQSETSILEQEKLLYDLLPLPIAQELIAYGSVSPVGYSEATVMFSDFTGFTASSKKILPRVLISALEYYFDAFDAIISKHHLEKIKTIGDGYMCVGGVPNISETHAIDCVLAALEMMQFVHDNANQIRQQFRVSWNLRIGINTGQVIAGVIGKKRIAYDIWGSTVNIASKLESFGEKGKISISAATYEKVKSYFEVTAKPPIALTVEDGQVVLIDIYTVEKQKKSIFR